MILCQVFRNADTTGIFKLWYAQISLSGSRDQMMRNVLYLWITVKQSRDDGVE